ncbi:hypothetical protein [Tahibacter harae]|uniref:WD40 repeat protein n=1 Tax=Tahibacter harae TaxID=2963937 RepID=A0ABT1QWI0_9GAMM|nr:hypothetical protein [Tahibacter harae]MCQ4166616.1 hypothetical protein [Tahibacter harae]
MHPHNVVTRRARGFLSVSPPRSLLALGLLLGSGLAGATEVDLISQTSITSPIPNDGNQFIPSFSSSGRHVVFSSTASTLLSEDRLGLEDVYTYDQQTSTLALVSRSLSGRGGNSYSSGAQVTADGGLVVFYSAASDLVAGDSNGTEDIFLWTRATNTITRLGLPTVGQSNGHSFFPRITPDGRYVLFTSNATNLPGADPSGLSAIYRLDRQTGTLLRVDTNASGVASNGGARGGDISDDGSKVVFASQGTNLDAADTNAAYDLYLKDLSSGSIRLASRTTGNVSANVAVDTASWGRRISSDGSKVVFTSRAALTAGSNTLGQAYLYDDLTASVTLLSQNAGAPSNGACNDVRIAPGALTVYFSCLGDNLVVNDTNGVIDVFSRTLATSTNLRHSVSGTGAQGGSDSYGPAFSDNGGYVAFLSIAQELYAGAPSLGGFNLFVRNTTTGALSSPSLSSAQLVAAAGNNHVAGQYTAAISTSADLNLVVFTSAASNMVGGDTNALNDVFLRNRSAGTLQRLSVDNNGNEVACSTDNPALTPDGRYVVARSCGDLALGSVVGSNVYRYDRNAGQWQAVTRDSDGFTAVFNPVISDNGSVVIFGARQPGSSLQRIWLRSETARAFGNPELVSATPTGTFANGAAIEGQISGDGRFVVFSSSASDLVSGDTNNQQDVFVRDLQANTTERVSVSAAGVQGAGFSGSGSISADGRYVVFVSSSWLGSGAAPTPAPGRYLYRRDRQAGTLESLSTLQNGSIIFGGSIASPQISRDGSRVVFQYSGYIPALSWSNTVPATVILDVASRSATTLMRGDGRVEDGTQSWPRFSPNGDAVAFISYGSGYGAGDGNRAIADAYLVTDWDRIFGGRGGSFEP